MPFTDDDLLILKSNLPYWGARTQSQPNHLEGLIYRMECAEKIICSYSKFDYDEDRKLLVKKWLRSKGVEGA